MGPVGLWDLDIGVRVLAFMAGMELKSLRFKLGLEWNY